jgi:hypothetical protein
MRKSLAIVAVAHHAVDFLRRGILDPAYHLAAAAAHFHVFAHVPLRYTFADVCRDRRRSQAGSGFWPPFCPNISAS